MNFVKDLKVILMDCEYENPGDVLVACIIYKVVDSKLQEKLLDRGGDLSLSKAIEVGQQFHESKTTVSGYCKIRGHWQAVCRDRPETKVQTATHADEGESSEEEIATIYAFSLNDAHDKWNEKLKVNNQDPQFRIGTGAKCNIILKTDFQKINNPGKLEKTYTVLKSYSNHVIKSLGRARLTVQSKTSTVETKFQIVDIKAENIISGDLAEELGLISKVEVIKTSDSESELSDYPEVTSITGLLPGTYKIKLGEGSKGVIHACREFPPTLKEKINSKLLEMEQDNFLNQS
ncbi:Pol polyprotein [Elysia marginata]|uniref:Pol polyprotein n=1 Tax=Elysia marginata TaxID=1093978 RepID=A0AAV4HM22_9GAST|nr:Pol polyprotein [Elysia marginata]